MNKLTKDLLTMAREGYAWPGGYPLVLLMGDGGCLCPKCLRENYTLVRRTQREGTRRDSWFPVSVFIHWEGAPIQCDHCYTQIESAYGDPEEECA
jgi:hypothetical protein